MAFRTFHTLTLFLAFVLIFSACKNGLLFEYPELSEDQEVNLAEFRIVTYNIHGGNGPNGEGAFTENLTAFKQLLNGESIVCLQEVEPDSWNELKNIFSDYAYRYYLVQCSTKFATNKRGGNAIFSRYPIIDFDQRLIQTDPGGDKWERKAQYVRIRIGYNHQYLNLFHYHNTYNWHNDASASELAGFEKFAAYVASKGISSSEMTVLAGDFNVNLQQCRSVLGNGLYPNESSNWVDHIFTNAILLNSGSYPTYTNALSDHDAVWAVLCNLDC